MTIDPWSVLLGALLGVLLLAAVCWALAERDLARLRREIMEREADILAELETQQAAFSSPPVQLTRGKPDDFGTWVSTTRTNAGDKEQGK